MDTHGNTVRVLVLNCGSSSLKYKVIRMPDEQELVRGEAERVGIKTQGSPFIAHYVYNRKRVVEAPLADHRAAFLKVLALLKEDETRNKEIGFDVIAHRYVHPGTFFSKTTRVTEPELKKLQETLALAPLHNPISYGLVELCAREFPALPQYVVFDTAFHAHIPEELFTYALPRAVSKKYGIRKVGFHGISHNYVMLEACRYLGRDPKTQKIISCHLGTGGSSVCAIKHGTSISNSMGFTPLEGLIMNTRSGDLDPGLVFYLMSHERFSAEEVESILNKKSGVLGIFQSSSDLRDVVPHRDTSAKARMAFTMYVRRVKKYISYYSLLLKNADILIFTDSIGIGMPAIREGITEGLGIFGIAMDKDKNNNYQNGTVDISRKDSPVRILVVPTDEEIMIAREAYKESAHDNRRCP